MENSKNKNIKNKVFKLIKNKYILAILIFLCFFLFIDENSVVTTIRLRKQLNELKQKQEYYSSECENDSIQLIKLQKDIDWVEKFGRENYYMKRNNEDVFIISRKKE